MNNFFRVLILILLFLQSSFSSEVVLTKNEKDWLGKHPNIKFGADAFWPPFDYLDKEGNYQGFNADMLKIINERLGINIEVVTGDRDELQELLKKKKLDGLMSPPKTKEREKFTVFTEPYVEVPTILITKQEKNIRNLEDLKDLSVAIAKGNTNISYVKTNFPKIDIKIVPTDLDALLATSTGDVEASIMSLSSASFNIGENFINNLKITQKFLTPHSDIRLAVRDDWVIFRDILQKALNSISKKEWKDITNNWIFLEQGIKKLNNYELELSSEEKLYLRENSPLKVQALATFPPFNFSQNGNQSGYSVDYMKLIGSYLGVEVEFVDAKSFGETISMFKRGEIDILPHIAKNKRREEFIDYTNFNHIEYSIGVTIRKDEEIFNMEDLEDKTIAVVNKTFVQTYLKRNYPNQKLLAFPSTSDAVEAVSLAKADALIGSIPTMNFYIQKNWLSNVKTTKIENIGLPSKVSMPMGVQKNNKILKSILEKANLSITHNEIVNLKEKWLNIQVKDNSLLLTEEEKNYLAKKKSIKMCVLPDWFPFEKIDKNGNHRGIGADIISIVSEKLETPFALLPTKEWTQSLKNIRERKCDILPVAMNVPSRRDVMNFTKPYDIEPFVIATKDNATFIKDSSELKNKKVAIVKNYAFIEVLKKHNPSVHIVGVKNAKDGLERVRSGEIFGYVDIIPVIMYTMQQNSLVDLKISGKLEFDIKLSMASRNDEPLLNSILQKTLSTIGEDKIKEIVAKRMSVKVDQRVDYSLLWQISLFFMLIILIILYKSKEVSSLNNKLLKATKEIQEQQVMVDRYVTDLNGTITEINEAYSKTIGFSKEELIGSKHDTVRHPDTPEEVFKDLWSTISAGQTWKGEIKNLNRDRDTLYFIVIIEPLIKDNVKVGYRAISKDITDKKRIEELSITDKLTGLYNRLKIDELLLKQVNYFKRYKTPFSIILFDVDNFKSINDNFGHDIGDFVLEKLSKVAKRNIRKTDEIGRWGGEEFIVICTNTNIDDAYILAENLRKNIESANFGKVGTVTVSLGVSSFLSADSMTTIFKRVDRALYQAKKNNKNCTISL